MANQVGIIAGLRTEGSSFQEVADFGLTCCQLVSWNPAHWTEEAAQQIRADYQRLGMHVTALWAGWPGPAVWDFAQGPDTLGIVPRQYRAERVTTLKQAADFAHRLGVPAIITHLGFIPENPSDPSFGEVVAAVREIALHCQELGMEFWFETGQETPVTMLRLIQAIGTGNLGINLDPANLILYGKASPVDALDVFGTYVRNVHAKDGLYPTDPMQLGREVKVGAGRVRFPELVRRLAELGFTGEYIIEREISGEEQRRDIAETVSYLRGLLEEA